MKQLDIEGNLPPEPERKPFKDVRNLRPTVAEEKAQLCLRIGELCKKPPACVANGSIQLTRQWVEARKAALAVAKRMKATVPELTAALSSMERFK